MSLMLKNRSLTIKKYIRILKNELYYLEIIECSMHVLLQINIFKFNFMLLILYKYLIIKNPVYKNQSIAHITVNCKNINKLEFS